MKVYVVLRRVARVDDGRQIKVRKSGDCSEHGRLADGPSRRGFCRLFDCSEVEAVLGVSWPLPCGAKGVVRIDVLQNSSPRTDQNLAILLRRKQTPGQ